MGRNKVRSPSRWRRGAGEATASSDGNREPPRAMAAELNLFHDPRLVAVATALVRLPYFPSCVHCYLDVTRWQVRQWPCGRGTDIQLGGRWTCIWDLLPSLVDAYILLVHTGARRLMHRHGLQCLQLTKRLDVLKV
jgi:hypothetical protein